MLAKLKTLWVVCVGLSLALSACRSAQETPASPTVDANAILTAAAQTANARMTEMAAVTPTPTTAPTDTLAPVATSAAVTVTATLSANTAATLPAATSAAPAATQPAGGAPAANKPDRMQFVADLTVPDGTNFDPGDSFTKTWRLQNAGTTTWTTSYALVFSSGEQLGAPSAVPVPVEVAPNATVDISVEMTAPDAAGHYIGYWMMRNASSSVFGLGPNADQPIYVDINVGGAAASTTGTPVAQITSTSSTGSGNSIVADVTWLGDDEANNIPCPFTWAITGQFTLNKAANVTYFLEILDDKGDRIFSSGKQTKQFSAGTHQIPFSLEISESTTGSVEFAIDGPEKVSTGPESFYMNCQGG